MKFPSSNHLLSSNKSEFFISFYLLGSLSQWCPTFLFVCYRHLITAKWKFAFYQVGLKSVYQILGGTPREVGLGFCKNRWDWTM